MVNHEPTHLSLSAWVEARYGQGIEAWLAVAAQAYAQDPILLADMADADQKRINRAASQGKATPHE